MVPGHKKKKSSGDQSVPTGRKFNVEENDDLSILKAVNDPEIQPARPKAPDVKMSERTKKTSPERRAEMKGHLSSIGGLLAPFAGLASSELYHVGKKTVKGAWNMSKPARDYGYARSKDLGGSLLQAAKKGGITAGGAIKNFAYQNPKASAAIAASLALGAYLKARGLRKTAKIGRPPKRKPGRRYK
jgi:hypothetical protein